MFQVEWVQSALDKLATIWTEAGSVSREAITSVVGQIDKYLRFEPQAQGESREQNRRTLFVAPLGIDFQVEADDRKVIVLRVWLARRRKP